MAPLIMVVDVAENASWKNQFRFRSFGVMMLSSDTEMKPMEKNLFHFVCETLPGCKSCSCPLTKNLCSPTTNAFGKTLHNALESPGFHPFPFDRLDLPRVGSVLDSFSRLSLLSWLPRTAPGR